jgi:aryl-alcohol dehydrogenase-like predicted oxidoreductase
LSGDGYGFVSDAEADRVIDRAVALGITLFETADCYGRGDLERKLGKRLPGGRTFVVTKVGTSLEGYAEKRFDADYLVGALERSQERLRRDALDVVLLHNPTMATFQLDETFELLERLRGEARIRAWGVSACSPLVAERALARGAQVLEMAYNALFFRDVRELGARLREVGAGLLARSVLSYGLLAGGFTKEREFYPPDHRADSPPHSPVHQSHFRCIQSTCPPSVPRVSPSPALPACSGATAPSLNLDSRRSRPPALC